jgi:hypothetical protein
VKGPNGTRVLGLSEVNAMHVIIAGLLLAAYVGCAFAGSDGSPLLYVLAGQLGGRGATLGMRRVNGNSEQ